ncbi:MAG TPA: SufE family protein [Acidimicrobiia bacterium]|nr:SufE family protein [Acidimicrobiia bacterium]
MALPSRLQTIVDVLAASPREFRLEALLDYSKRIPDLPPRFADDPSLLEAVPECQTPFFLATEIDDDGAAHMFFSAPPESPTVRGFAGLLLDGLEGLPPEEILAVPNDFYVGMGLEEVVTPLRMRGMGAILGRIKRQLAEAQRSSAPA